MAKVTLPSEHQIRKYWAVQGIWKRKGYDSEAEWMEKRTCMACGWQRVLGVERAHIQPRVHGGANTVDNLHLLCQDCHHASEYLEGAEYWRWFYATNQETTLLVVALRSGKLSTAEIHGWLRRQRRHSHVQEDDGQYQLGLAL